MQCFCIKKYNFLKENYKKYKELFFVFFSPYLLNWAFILGSQHRYLRMSAVCVCTKEMNVRERVSKRNFLKRT